MPGGLGGLGGVGSDNNYQTGSSVHTQGGFVVYDLIDNLLGGPGEAPAPEQPGDLGSLYYGANTLLLKRRALRESATQNVPYFARNHRYAGHRQSSLFNLAMQAVLTVSAQAYYVLDARNTAATVVEMNLPPVQDSDPALDETSLFYHIREQLTFKEWLLLKDADNGWF